MPRKKKATTQSSPTLAHVHATHEAFSSVECEPPHPPRKETPIYRATHRRLIITEDRPCYVCGVRRSDLLNKARRNDPRVNPYHATAMESHHWPLERSLMAAVDVTLLAQAYLTVREFKTLEEWVDSEYNMLVLCLTGETPVLMASGEERAIADIAVGDMVIGSDLRPHAVTETMRHPVDESLVVVDGVRMTRDHLVLTSGGWFPAGALKGGEVIRAVRMLSAHMLGLAGVEPQVFNAVVSAIPVDMVDALLRGEQPSEMLLHHVAMLHDRVVASIRPPVSALPVALGVDSDAVQSRIARAFLPVQSDDTAGVRTVTSQAKTYDPGGLEREGFAAFRAGAFCSSPMHRLTPGRAASARARAVVERNTGGDTVSSATYRTILNDRGDMLLLLAGWRPINQLNTLTFSGEVYDIGVEGCHDFVTSGYVVHNCSACHRLADHAIHRALWQDVIATKFALRDAQTGQRFEFAATAADAAATEAADETLVEEAAVAAVVAPILPAAPSIPSIPSIPSAPAEAHSSPSAGDAPSPPSKPGPSGSAPPVVVPARPRRRASVRRAAAAVSPSHG